jgi:dynactin complex subunit
MAATVEKDSFEKAASNAEVERYKKAAAADNDAEKASQDKNKKLVENSATDQAEIAELKVKLSEADAARTSLRAKFYNSQEELSRESKSRMGAAALHIENKHTAEKVHSLEMAKLSGG